MEVHGYVFIATIINLRMTYLGDLGGLISTVIVGVRSTLNLQVQRLEQALDRVDSGDFRASQPILDQEQAGEEAARTDPVLKGAVLV